MASSSRGRFRRYSRDGKKWLLFGSRTIIRMILMLSIMMVSFVWGGDVSAFLPVVVVPNTRTVSRCKRRNRRRQDVVTTIVTRHTMNPPPQRLLLGQDNENPHDKMLQTTKENQRVVRITGPECRDDYEQVGWLLAKSQEEDIMLSSSSETKQEKNPLGLLLRAWRQSVETRRHIQVARRLAGFKYKLLLAKTTPTTSERSPEPTKEVVVGFLELGVSQMNGTITTQSKSRGDGVMVVVTVGMVCVDPAMQQGGIGRALVEAAHVVARDSWNETCIVAAIEQQPPNNNTAARQLFHNCGYRPWMDDNDGTASTQRVVMVPVRSSSTTPWNGSPMERPHHLFVKHLTPPSSSTNKDNDTIQNDEPIITMQQNESSSSI